MNGEIILKHNYLSHKSILDDLKKCNEITEQYGLVLSYEQLLRIDRNRIDALNDMDRVEFGQGVATKLISAFCDSPYIDQNNYEETISGLLEIFYYFKNEALEKLSDDYLIRYMKDKFNNVCQGSLEHLSTTVLEKFCREIREND